MTFRIASLAFLLTPVLCTPPCATKIENREAEEAAIQEAVFRYQFKHNASGAQSDVDFYFLSLGDDRDPSPEFMTRFQGHVPQVAPVSAAEGVTHRESGGTGLIFRVERICWIDDETVEVEGGYYEGPVSSSGNTYRVRRRGGKWVVTRNTMHWIS